MRSPVLSVCGEKVVPLQMGVLPKLVQQGLESLAEALARQDKRGSGGSSQRRSGTVTFSACELSSLGYRK